MIVVASSVFGLVMVTGMVITLVVILAVISCAAVLNKVIVSALIAVADGEAVVAIALTTTAWPGFKTVVLKVILAKSWGSNVELAYFKAYFKDPIVLSLLVSGLVLLGTATVVVVILSVIKVASFFASLMLIVLTVVSAPAVAVILTTTALSRVSSLLSKLVF